MRLSNAPRLDEERECPICDAEGKYVLYEGDKMCRTCGHVPSPSSIGGDEKGPWKQWHEHRKENEEYSGFTGENRIKFVGGFAAAYVFDDDF